MFNSGEIGVRMSRLVKVVIKFGCFVCNCVGKINFGENKLQSGFFILETERPFSRVGKGLWCNKNG